MNCKSTKIANVFVWYTPEGSILAVGRPGQDDGIKAIPIIGEHQHCVEMEVDESILSCLCETHRIDIGNKKLVLLDKPGAS